MARNYLYNRNGGDQQKSRDDPDDELNSRSRMNEKQSMANTVNNYGNAQYKTEKEMVTENKLTSERADKPMDKKHRNILRNVRVGLVTDMDPEDILLHMAASHVFSDKDEDEIKAKRTRQRQCQTLLCILPKRGAKAFSSFVKALGKVHPHLANLIFEAEIKELNNELTIERAQSAQLRRRLSVPGNQPTCLRCHELEEKLVASRKEVEASEQNKINQLELKQEELEGYKKQIAELEEANIQQKKVEENLLREKNELEQNNHFNENIKKIKQLEEENKGLKSDVASKNEEYAKVRIELDNLTKKMKQDSKKTEGHRAEVEEWKSKCQKFKEEAITRNKGRVLLPIGMAFLQFGVIRTLKSENHSVVATRSSNGPGKANDILDHRKCSTSGTGEREGSWWSVDLGENMLLFVTHCALRHGKEEGDSILQHWELQGSIDGIKYKTLAKENKPDGPPPFRDPHPYYTGMWSVKGEVKAFRFFRILQTGRNSSNKYGIYLSGVELYGVLLKL